MKKIILLMFSVLCVNSFSYVEMSKLEIEDLNLWEKVT